MSPHVFVRDVRQQEMGDGVWLPGSLLCPLRVRGDGAGRVGPIHAEHRDLELRGEDRRELEQSSVPVLGRVGQTQRHEKKTLKYELGTGRLPGAAWLG